MAPGSGASFSQGDSLGGETRALMLMRAGPGILEHDPKEYDGFLPRGGAARATGSRASTLNRL